jgi:hypothetical protein
MARTYTLAGGDARITVRAIENPSTQYGYAVVVNLDGALATLLRRSAETAAKDVLASHRTASWTWLDGDALSIRITREDPAHAAEVIDEVLDGIEETFAAEGLDVLAWRDVPQTPEAADIGATAIGQWARALHGAGQRVALDQLTMSPLTDDLAYAWADYSTIGAAGDVQSDGVWYAVLRRSDEGGRFYRTQDVAGPRTAE